MDESRKVHIRAHAKSNATTLDHTHLVAPTLSHLGECPAIGCALASIVEQSLQSGKRFPHTLLIGDADSSKRVIAATIAAEMAVPIHYVDLVQIRSGDALHAVLRHVTAGAIVLMSGIDCTYEGTFADLARAVNGRERIKEPSLTSWMREMTREEWQKNSRQASMKYPDFTVILTGRKSHSAHATYLRWVERHYFTKQYEGGEVARLSRLFRHTDRTVDDDVICLIAKVTTTFGVRTLEAANAIVERMRSSGIERLDQRTYGEHFENMFAALLDPKRVAAYEKKLARLEQAARKTAAAEAVMQATTGAGMQVPDAASNSGGAIAA